jgi:hypothetical protein
LAIGLAVPVLTVFFKVSEVLGWTFLRSEVAVETGSSDQYPILMLVSVWCGLGGEVVALIAVARERSWLVWVATVPGLLFFSFVIWALGSMSIGHDANPWVTFSISVLLWAVMVFNIWISTRNSGKSRYCPEAADLRQGRS